GDLGYHGNRQVKTPQLDAFAREAVELANFHVSPVCSPTRASLMTGRYNFRTGVCDVFKVATCMDPAEVTLAETLRAAGYTTGLFGKWHLGDGPAHNPNAQGFDEALTFPGPAMRKYFDPELIHNGAKTVYPGERSIEGPPRMELYDLAADPGETKDLAAEQPAVVEKMARQYEAWFSDVTSRWQRP
ncbi:MAG: sulfatase-like hydrolase/transferase, partial [Thermoguttaceae bacterium]